MTFYSGAYTGTYDSSTLGRVESGYEMEYIKQGEPIIIEGMQYDGVYQGVMMKVSFVLTDWEAAGAVKAYWPFSTTFGAAGTLGVLDTSLAKALVLTACDLTNDPQTITFHLALLANEASVRHAFARRHRKVPITMLVYPVESDGTPAELGDTCAAMKFFTET